MYKTLSGRLQELKNKVQSWVIPKVSKVVAVAYESLSLQILNRHRSERGYTEVVITRAGRLPDHEWLQGGASAVFRTLFLYRGKRGKSRLRIQWMASLVH